MTAAERCEVGPVVGVGAFRRRRQVRPGEIVFDRSRKLGEDPRVFPGDRAERTSRRCKRRPLVRAGLSVDLRFYVAYSLENRESLRA